MRPPRTPHRCDAASPQPAAAFNPGDPVEVVADEPGLRGAHFAAVVVGPSTEPRGYTVEYDALLESEGSDRKQREALPARSLRPRPPPASGEAPAVHAAVDALHDIAWWLGVALGGADGAGKVKVCFPETREVIEFDAANVRPHLEWVDGEWCSPDSMEISKTMPYTKGMQIEVSKWEGDSIVAWLPAAVAKTIWKNNLLVVYAVPRSDGIALSEEIVDVKHVRPCPPQASAISFCINDDVEAFQGCGWWLGVITDVHPELKYTFKPAHLGVEVQLGQKLLRPRSAWVDGQWKLESQKRKTQVDRPPGPVPSLTKKHKSPKLGPSEENKHRESSSKDIYPDIDESCPLRDVPRLNDQVPPMIVFHQLFEYCAHDTSLKPVRGKFGQAEPAPQPEPTPAPAQRRKDILKMSLTMTQPAVAPEATVLPPTWGSDAQKNEAVQNTPPEVGKCSNSPANSLDTPLDSIIKDLKGCREQWLKSQSQLDHSATKVKELEAQVTKLRSASEADTKHLREAMDKQAVLKRRLELKDKEIQDLKKKLTDLGEQTSCVEAKLPRRAVKAETLAHRARLVVKPFVKRLGLSVSSASDAEA